MSALVLKTVHRYVADLKKVLLTHFWTGSSAKPP